MSQFRKSSKPPGPSFRSLLSDEPASNAGTTTAIENATEPVLGGITG